MVWTTKRLDCMGRMKGCRGGAVRWQKCVPSLLAGEPHQLLACHPLPVCFHWHYSRASDNWTRAAILMNLYHPPPLNKSNHFVEMTINVDPLPISFVALVSCSALSAAFGSRSRRKRGCIRRKHGGFRRKATPLRSRPDWVGGKSFGVTESATVSPKVFAPGGAGMERIPGRAQRWAVRPRGCPGASQSFSLRRQAGWLKVWRGGGCRFERDGTGTQAERRPGLAEWRLTGLATTSDTATKSTLWC
jgi:hypothetical protein